MKAPLYARSGIVEYWLVDLTNDTLTRHTAPKDGTYREVSVRERGERLSPSALPDCAIAVDDLINIP